MPAEVLDGRVVAEQVRSKIKLKMRELAGSIVEPHLVTILVGDDPASRAYLKNNQVAFGDVGMRLREVVLDAKTPQSELERIIGEFNDDKAVTGILLPLPLPAGLNETASISAISKEKDVDGLNPCNIGLLAYKTPSLVPCTPSGIIVLLKYYHIRLAGKHVVVINRSKPVGRPLAQLLLNEDATVTVCHSKTHDLTGISRTADVLITGIGRRNEFVVGSNMIKPGAVVVDVGTSTVCGKIVGDVDFEVAMKIASYVTPVPGGVGPMTTCMLLYNSVLAACMQSHVDIGLGFNDLAANQ
jgi:methylenetetrahydrofolate dehydrogenase (NADP+)/methenyltetrahydrofolate cyclohydrolase